MASLVLLPFSSSLAVMAALVFVFYLAYFTYYPAYRTLFPDLVPEHLHGRAQSSQALWRGVGLGLALVGGGALLEIWRPLPFVLGAVVLAAVTLTLAALVQESSDDQGCCLPLGRAVGVHARGCQEFRCRVLFIVVGLGRSAGFASLVIGVVAGASLVAALIGGALADRYGFARVMRIALWVYGLGLFVPFLTQSAVLVLPVLPCSLSAAQSP